MENLKLEVLEELKSMIQKEISWKVCFAGMSKEEIEAFRKGAKRALLVLEQLKEKYNQN